MYFQLNILVISIGNNRLMFLVHELNLKQSLILSACTDCYDIVRRSLGDQPRDERQSSL